MSLLSSLTSITSSKGKRVGRGIGSGKGGHTASRGNKGQRARTGGKIPVWFEGGQLPLIKRMPMWRGKGKFKVVRPTAEVSLSEVENMKSSTISLETLKIEEVIDPRFKKAKIVASGSISRAVEIQGILVSKSAQAAIEKAGGSVK